MRYTDPQGSSFDTDNRTWTRLTTVLAEHFDLLTWRRDDDRPVLVTVLDPHTGDTVSLSVLDSHEAHEAHLLLAVDRDGTLSLHGPFPSAGATRTAAGQLALADPDLAATCPTALHPPQLPHLPDSAWVDLPDNLPDLRADWPPAPGPTCAVLLDRDRGRLAAVGPFPDPDAAGAWSPQPTPEPGVDLHVITLRPPAAATDGDGPEQPDPTP